MMVLLRFQWLEGRDHTRHTAFTVAEVAQLTFFFSFLVAPNWLQLELCCFKTERNSGPSAVFRPVYDIILFHLSMQICPMLRLSNVWYIRFVH